MDDIKKEKEALEKKTQRTTRMCDIPVNKKKTDPKQDRAASACACSTQNCQNDSTD